MQRPSNPKICPDIRFYRVRDTELKRPPAAIAKWQGVFYGLPSHRYILFATVIPQGLRKDSSHEFCCIFQPRNEKGDRAILFKFRYPVDHELLIKAREVKGIYREPAIQKSVADGDRIAICMVNGLAQLMVAAAAATQPETAARGEEFFFANMRKCMFFTPSEDSAEHLSARAWVWGISIDQCYTVCAQRLKNETLDESRLL